MSLLEDVFLQDEANEAQELERIIEGDEFEERPRSDSDDNSEKEDEAEEDKRRVDPTTTKTKRIIKNPRFVLNPARLTGPRGIQVIPDHFKDFKFKGKGHEREDLDLVLKKLEHWAYRLYPKFQFEDCLKKIETLGRKRPVMVHLTKIRSDQHLSEETVVQNDTSDEEVEKDEFDMLLQEQIELTRLNTPGSVKKGPNQDNGSLIMPKATSSPSISEEQRERMLRNRKLAEERRLARLKNQCVANNDNTQSHQEPTTSNLSDNDKFDNINNDEMVENNTKITKVRHHRLDVIDSSDEDEALTVNESVRVDIHNTVQNNDNIEENLTNNAKGDNYDVDKENNQGLEILQNNKSFDKSNDDIEENITSNAKGDNYDVDKENQGLEILQSNKSFDKSNDNIEENLTINAKVDNYDGDKENQGLEVLQSNKSFDKSNDNIEENLTINAKGDNYDGDKENKGLEMLQNNQSFDKSNDDIEENFCDKTSVILNTCSNNGNKLIENEINGADTMSSNIQESTNTDEIPDQVKSTNQITDKNQVNSTENIEDLMDVDFSDDF